MAEKILQTRIINKNAELGTWNTSDLVLKEGEIALAKVMVPQPDGTVAPTFVAKIGNGATFTNSPWLFAKASDVYSWAKKETLEYEALPATLKQQITDLQSAVGGEGSVSSMIQAAIEALDVAESKDTDETNGGIVISSIKEVDGKISVTRRALTDADIASLNVAMSKVTGLSDALDLKADKTTIGSTEDAAGTATVYGAIATAKKAGDDAQTYAEGVADDLSEYETTNDARVKAIEDDYTTAAQAGTIAEGKVTAFNTATVAPLAERVTTAESGITNLAGDGRTTETVKANADAIAKLKEDIGNVANVMNFRGVSTSETVGADISDPKAGDVIIFGEAEYVYDESGEWIKFGDASDNATAISDLQGRVTNVENDLKAGGATYQAIVAAKTQADQGVADAKTANDAIAIINGEDEGSIKKTVSDAVTEVKGYADAATEKVADDLEAYITSNNTAVASALKAGTDAQTYAEGVQTNLTNLINGQVKTNTENIAANVDSIASIEANFAKVKTTTVDEITTYSLVVGENEDVIIFDCGGAE